MITSAATDGVRTIALDRPERRNALTSDGLGAIRDAVERAGEPVVCLEGRGEAFCAGADLEEVAALADGEDAREFAKLGQGVTRALASYDGAVVAAIDGPAVGGGVELALACDVRVCTPRSTFAESGASIGLFGAWGGTVRLPAVVGPGVARDLALTARTIDAEEALGCGLVSQVRADPDSVAREIAGNDASAVRSLVELLGPTDDAVGHRPADGTQADRVATREAREREAFAALVESGRPQRTD